MKRKEETETEQIKLCKSCNGYGYITEVIRHDNGRTTITPQQICPNCDGKGRYIETTHIIREYRPVET